MRIGNFATYACVKNGDYILKFNEGVRAAKSRLEGLPLV